MDIENWWNFPHCTGAMDGKHIDIIPPRNLGSYYFNYKENHSMVLLAIVDANYRFPLVDFGTNGRESDGGVLQNTRFYEKLVEKNLHVPPPDDWRFKKYPLCFRWLRKCLSHSDRHILILPKKRFSTIGYLAQPIFIWYHCIEISYFSYGYKFRHTKHWKDYDGSLCST